MKSQLIILFFLCSVMTYGQEIILSSKIVATSGANRNFNTVNISQWKLGEVHQLTFGENTVTKSESNITTAGISGWDVTSYPNPFTDDLNLNFQTDKEMKVAIQVIDLNGKKVFEQNGRPVLNGQVINLQLGNLVTGTYLVSVIPENDKIFKVFKVQKSE